MSAIINFSIKNNDGSYSNYTMSVNDTPDKYGYNASITLQQTKEERESKKPKVYVGNGRVNWTDGNIQAVKYEPKNTSDKIRESKDDLPF
jgi:hypothetical protein